MTGEAALLAAHAARDAHRIVTLYAEAAGSREGDGRAFLLTQAWVHALEAGDPRAEVLGEALRGMGRA